MAMRRSFLVLVLLGFLAAAAVALGAEQNAAKHPDRPNIVVILADDLGYGGLSCQGGDLQTPHVDSLARSGVRFTNGYVSGPVCSPTRAGLNTGRYQQRFGHEFNPGPPAEASVNFGLPLTEATIAARLKAAGYTTGMFGKWHLGYRRECLPLSRGFDEFMGFPGGAHPYLNPRSDSNNPILRGYEPIDEKEYLTDAFTREAVAFVDHHAKDSKPFYLYLPYNAVHLPMDATEKYLERFPQIQDPLRRKHAAMLAAMDDGVGAVMAALQKNGLEEQTLVFFLSDNGGPTPKNTSTNKPLRGFKGQVLEGGIRIPFMISWKGHLPAGRLDDRPVIQLDIMPTAVAVAGGTMPNDRPIDGVDLMPYLTGKQAGPPHEVLFWRMGPQAAVRKGDWKLIRHEGSSGNVPVAARARRDARAGAAVAQDATAAQAAVTAAEGAAPGARRRAAARRAQAAAGDDAGSAGVAGIGPVGSVQLYNLAKDIHEDNDLAAENPEKVKELTAALDAWESHLARPLWGGRPRFQNAPASQPAGRRAGNAQGRRARRNQ
jgi:arylsulfatase A-like enzyme